MERIYLYSYGYSQSDLPRLSYTTGIIEHINMRIKNLSTCFLIEKYDKFLY